MAKNSLTEMSRWVAAIAWAVLRRVAVFVRGATSLACASPFDSLLRDLREAVFFFREELAKANCSKR